MARFRGGAGLPPAGGGGARKFSLIKQQATTITAAQLKALGAVGIDVVPAAGADILLVPVSCTLLFHYTAPQYATLAANEAARDLALTVNGIAVTHWMSSAVALQPASDRATFMYPNDASDNSGLPDTGASFLTNEPLQLWNWSGVEYTDGNGTLTVCVSYLKLNVVSGLYI